MKNVITCGLPHCSMLLDRTPSLNLTGFESVIVVLNTFARPSTCNTRIRADFEQYVNKLWVNKLWVCMKYVDIGKTLRRRKLPWPSKSTAPWTQSESVVQLALGTLKYYSEVKQVFNYK